VRSFEDIYYAYKNLVCSIILKKRIPPSDAEDVFMEVWQAAARSLRSGSEVRNFQSWLGVITLRRCADFWRRRPPAGAGARPIGGDGEEGGVPADHHDPRQRAMEREIVEIVDRALERLPFEERFVLRKRLDGFKYREIALMLSSRLDHPVDANRVGKIILEAKERLASILENMTGFRRGRYFPE